MGQIRLAVKIIKTQVKDRMYYPGRLVVDTFRVVARYGVLLALYWYVFKLNDGTINNISYVVVAWSMFLYFAFSLLDLRHISHRIMEDIRSGNIEVLFSRPISYLLYRIWFHIGSGLYSFLVIATAGVFLLAFFVGFPEIVFSSVFFPTLILTGVFGVILSLLLYSIIGLFAFWIEDINPIFWTIDKTVMILGGSYLPVALFPSLMYKIAVYSPFGATHFLTHTVYDTWLATWYLKVGIQLFWIIIFFAVTYFLFQKAKKKVSVNGG